MARIILQGDRSTAGRYLVNAKNLLSNLKNRMKLGRLMQASDMLTLKDARIAVSSAFGQDEIWITGIDGGFDVLFLYGNVTATWILKSDCTLTVISKNIASAISVWQPTGESFDTSTTKSSPDFSEHQVSITTTLYQAQHQSSSFYRYGSWEEYTPIIHLMNGMRNDWTPTEWDVDGTYVFDKDRTYKTYDLNNYVCSSRHPSIFWNGQVIKNLELWNDHISYETSEGIQSLSYPGAIGTPYVILTPELFVYFTLSGDTRQLFFGDVLLDDLTAETTMTESEPYPGDIYWIDYDHGGICRVIHDGNLYDGSFEITSGALSPPFNYDNRDGDETFIIFHNKTASTQSGSWTGGNRETFSGVQQSGSGESSIDSYYNSYLSYRLNNGATQKILLTEATFSSSSSTTHTECSSSTSETSSFTGQRVNIFSITCAITGNYIIYSYVIENYVGTGGPSSYESYTAPNTNWEFFKRVIGVINIETGIRLDHEVTDEFLGPYSESFDKTLPAAIGRHIKT